MHILSMCIFFMRKRGAFTKSSQTLHQNFIAIKFCLRNKQIHTSLFYDNV